MGYLPTLGICGIWILQDVQTPGRNLETSDGLAPSYVDLLPTALLFKKGQRGKI